jgi:lipoate-protein ligase A
LHKVYISDSYNPYFNLAFEEYLVLHHNGEDQVLFLWQNQKTIVIGRNQNPWKECNLEELDRQKGRLVRRLSGGGAVYHDLGNLNFTFISTYTDNKLSENIGLIVKALSYSGINADFSGKNDILVQGYKISGNAFYVENDILCHHGTLLFDVDLEKMSRILTVSHQKLQSKGIDSIRSRVRNLRELNTEISIEGLKADLTTAFAPVATSLLTYRVCEDKSDDEYIELMTVRKLMDRYASWEWNFGSSPEFNLQFAERFSWGEVDVSLLVKDGIVNEIEVYTDALDVDLPQRIKDAIINMRFDYEELFFTIDNCSNSSCKVF